VKISTRRAGTLAAATVVALATVLGGAATGAEVGPPELISAAPDGSAGNGPSLFPSVSEDGRYVAFRSEATNLVPEDTDPDRDVYVRDRQTGAVTLVSRASGAGGAKGNRQSYNPRISANGRFVVFRSNATNFVPEDTDQTEDIYVRDLQTNQTILVSRASTAVGPKGNGASTNAVISGDGRRVAFTSASTNLHPEDTDAIEDVYVRDRQTYMTEALSPALEAPYNRSFEAQIAADGSLVAYQADAGTAGSGSSVPPSDVFASAAPKLDRCLGKRTTMVATADDATKGTTGNDVILAAEGGEEIRSGKGNDRVCAGSGDDVVRTAGGRDKVEAGGGADEVIGGGDKDKLDGGGGKDELDGGAGPDKLDGGGGKDRCDGGAGADRLKACEVDEEEKGKGRDRQQGRDRRSPR
jgi:Ca2+-binding RTX toxin-like protein